MTNTITYIHPNKKRINFLITGPAQKGLKYTINSMPTRKQSKMITQQKAHDADGEVDHPCGAFQGSALVIVEPLFFIVNNNGCNAMRVIWTTPLLCCQNHWI